MDFAGCLLALLFCVRITVNGGRVLDLRIDLAADEDRCAREIKPKHQDYYSAESSITTELADLVLPAAIWDVMG